MQCKMTAIATLWQANEGKKVLRCLFFEKITFFFFGGSDAEVFTEKQAFRLVRIVESFVIQQNVRNGHIYIQLVKQLVPESAYFLKYWAKTDLKCLKSSKNPPLYEGKSHHSSIRDLLCCPMSMVVHIFYSIWELLEIPRVILSCTHVVLKLSISFFAGVQGKK